MFLYEAKQIPRKFLLLRPRCPDNSKKVFSRCNFSKNSVQVLSSMYSNVQLLYLQKFDKICAIWNYLRMQIYYT